MTWTRGGSNVAAARSPRHGLEALTLLVLAGTACGVTDVAVPVNAQPSSAVISVTPGGAGQQPVEATELDLVVGDSAVLTVTAVNALGFTVAGVSFTWSSQAPGVASVTGQGVVMGVAPGSTTIRAASGDVVASVAVTVEEPTVVPPPTP